MHTLSSRLLSVTALLSFTAFCAIAPAHAQVIGTGNNDVLTFQGTTQSVTATFVNPYSRSTVQVNGTYNVNNTTYDGLAGSDLLNMSPNSDFLTLNDGAGHPTLSNVETIVAGAGSDVLLLADTVLHPGPLLISGGDSDDIIWGNTGNDTIRGGNGDDLIDGGLGDDSMEGNNGNDTFIEFLGTGHDTIVGGTGALAGSDTIQFMAGIVAGDLHVTGAEGLYLITFGTLGDSLSIQGIQTLTFADGSSSTPESLVSAVPIPAAGWLLVSGLGAMGRLRRRRKVIQ